MNITHMLQIANQFNTGGTSLEVSLHNNIYSYAVTKNSPSKANDAFIKWIGEEQLKSICQIPELGLKYDKLHLSKETIRRIFLGYMHNKCLYPATHDQLNALFIGRAPKLSQFHSDLAIGAGKFMSGFRQRVFLLGHHYIQCKTENDPEVNRIREIELLTSRLADREIPEGTLIPLKNATYRVEKVFSGGGAYVLLLRDPNSQSPPKIVCRGTSARPFATGAISSCLNDVQIQIGTRGVKTIWKQLHPYLIQEGIPAVEVCGKSLGGAHAQQLAVMIEGIAKVQVRNLTTYCAVGVGRSVNKVFEERVLSGREQTFHIHVIRNGGDAQANHIDYVPLVGGEHLGAGLGPKCKIDVSYIHPGDDPVSTIPLHKMSFIKRIIKFIKSFAFAHNRQTTLSHFKIEKISSDKIDLHLRVGNLLEGARRIISYIIHYLSFTRFNGLSFSKYFAIKAKTQV